MRILKSKRNGYTVSLEIEAEHDKLDGAMDLAFQKMSKNAKVPGFRKGKLTRGIFEKYYGKESLLQEALMTVVNDAYMAALDEMKLEVVDYPRNVDIQEYKENKPIVFTCDVDVLPEVKLGKYKGHKVKQESPLAEDSVIDAEVNKIRENYAEYGLTERPVQKDDVARCNMTVSVEELPYEPWTRQNVGVRVGMKTFGEVFDEHLIGSKLHESKSVEIHYAEDYSNPDVAGKKVSITFEVVEIREKKLPELTDELAAKASKFQTVAELRADIKGNLDKQAEQKSKEKLTAELIKLISEDSKVDIPKPMVDREINFRINQLGKTLEQIRISMDQYLDMVKKTKDSLQQEFYHDAYQKVKEDLVIKAISDKEKIEATDGDLEKEILTWNLKEPLTLDQLRQDPQVDMENFKRNVTKKKTIDFIIEESKITR